MKGLLLKALSLTSSVALTIAFTTLGRYCWTWFYQPPVPQKLLDMEK